VIIEGSNDTISIQRDIAKLEVKSSRDPSLKSLLVKRRARRNE
jgi:hypothetical protein